MSIHNSSWYKAKVLQGEKVGRTIGFPTINLNPLVLHKDHKEGVYAAIVKYNNKEYKAALFFGPRKVHNETTSVLEIYIIDFDEDIYGETILFLIKEYIREVQNFSSMKDLKKQIQKDIEVITR